jgi:signal transduction histidine kinase
MKKILIIDDDVDLTFIITEMLENYGYKVTSIPDEDMPFIFDKFYRGNNSSDEQGSGLGLFIVKYLVEQRRVVWNLLTMTMD